MNFDQERSRRVFLGSAAASMVGLAGCIYGRGGQDDPEPTATATATPSPSATPTATATDTPTQTATETETATETPTPQADQDPWTGRQVGTVFDSFDVFDDQWDLDAGAAAISGRITHGGGQSVYLDSASDNRVRISRSFESSRDFRGTDFSMAVRLENTTKPILEPLLVLRDLFGNDMVLSGSVHPAATDRWVRLDLGVRKDKGADLSAIKEIRVDHWVGDSESQFYVDDIRTHEAPDRGYVMFTFDDDPPRDYSVAFPTLNDYGFTGTCFPNSEDLSSDSEPSIADYQEMQEAGWDIGCHTPSHRNLAKHSRREQRLIFERNIRQMEEMGFPHAARVFRTPYSSYNTHTLDLLPEFFDLSIVGAGAATGTNLEITDPRTVAFRGGDDYEVAKSLIDATVKHRQLLGLTLHMSDMSSRRAFEDLIAHAADHSRQGRLEVITPTTLLDEHLSD